MTDAPEKLYATHPGTWSTGYSVYNATDTRQSPRQIEYIRADRVRDLAKVTKQALLQWKMYDELSCWPGNDIEESNEPEAVEWRACVAALDEINLLLKEEPRDE